MLVSCVCLDEWHVLERGTLSRRKGAAHLPTFARCAVDLMAITPGHQPTSGMTADQEIVCVHWCCIVYSTVLAAHLAVLLRPPPLLGRMQPLR